MNDIKEFLIGIKLSEKNLGDIGKRIETTLSTSIENGMSLDRSGKAVVKKDMEVLLEYVREITSVISSAPPDIAKQLTGNLKNVLPMISGLLNKMRQVNDSTDWMKQGFTFGDDIYTTIKALDTVQQEVADVRAEVSELTTSLKPFLNALKANDPSKFFKKYGEGLKSVGNDASTMRATITKELKAIESSGDGLKNLMKDIRASSREFVDVKSAEEAQKIFDQLLSRVELYEDFVDSFGKGKVITQDIEEVRDYAKALVELENLSKNKFAKNLFDVKGSDMRTGDIKAWLQEIKQSIDATVKQAGDTLQRTVDGLNLKEVQLSVVLPEADAKKIEKQANDWVDKFNEKFKTKPIQLSVDMANPFKTYKAKDGKLTKKQRELAEQAKTLALESLRKISDDETLETNFSGLDDPETSKILRNLAESFDKIRKGVELGQKSILDATKEWRSEIEKHLTLSFKWKNVDPGDGANQLLNDLQIIMDEHLMQINVDKKNFIEQIEDALKTAQFNINGNIKGSSVISSTSPIVFTGAPVVSNPPAPPKAPPTPSEPPKSEDIIPSAAEIIAKPANALTRAVEDLDAEIESLKEKIRFGYEAVEQRKASKANADANIAAYNAERETADEARKLVLDILIDAANAAKNADIKEYNSTSKDDQIKVLTKRQAAIDEVIKQQEDPSKLVVDAVKRFYDNNNNQADRRLREIALIDKDLSAKYAEVINLEKEISKLNPATDGNKISELRGKIDAIKPEIDMLFGGVTESVVAEYIALEKQIEAAQQKYAQTQSSDDKLRLDGLKKRQQEINSGLTYLQNTKGVDKAFFAKFKEATDIERQIMSLDPIKDKSKMSDLEIQLKKIVIEMGKLFQGLKEKTSKELADIEDQLTEARKKYTLSNSAQDKKVVDQLEAKQERLTKGRDAVQYLENNRVKKQLFEQSGFRDYSGLDVNAAIQFVNEILRGSTTLADTLMHLSSNGVNIKGNILDDLIYFIPRVQEMMGIVSQSSQQWEQTDELKQRFLRIADLLQQISGLFTIRGNNATVESLQEFIDVFGKVPTLKPVVDAAKAHLNNLLELSDHVGDDIVYQKALEGQDADSKLFKLMQSNYTALPGEVQKQLQEAIPSLDFSKLNDKDIDEDLRQAITDKLISAFKSGGLDSNVFEQLKSGAPALQKFYEVLKLIVLYSNQLQTNNDLYKLTGASKTGYIGKLQGQIEKGDSMVATVGSGASQRTYGLQNKYNNFKHPIPGVNRNLNYDSRSFLSSLGIDKLEYEKFILSQGLFAERDKLQNEINAIIEKEDVAVAEIMVQSQRARLNAIQEMLKKSGTTATSEAEAKTRIKEIDEQMFANMSLSRPRDMDKQEYGYDQTTYAQKAAERARKVKAQKNATPEMKERLQKEIDELMAILSNREVILEAVRALQHDKELAQLNASVADDAAQKWKGYRTTRSQHRITLDNLFNKTVGEYTDESGNVWDMSEARKRFTTALQYGTMKSDVINPLLPLLDNYEDALAELRSMPEDAEANQDQLKYKDKLKAKLSVFKDQILDIYYEAEGWLLNDIFTSKIQSIETQFKAANQGVVGDHAGVESYYKGLKDAEESRYATQKSEIESKYADQIDMSNAMSDVRSAYEQERRELVSKKYNEKMEILQKAQEEELKTFENEINTKVREPYVKYKEAKAEYEKNETEETKAKFEEAEKTYTAVRSQGNIALLDFKKKQEGVFAKAKIDNWNEVNAEVPNELEDLEKAARDAANQTVESVVQARKEALRRELTKKVESGELSSEEAETQRLQGFANIDKQAQNGVIKGAITKSINKANKALEDFVKGIAEQYGITADFTEKTLTESIIRGDESAKQAELEAATTEHNTKMAEIEAQRVAAIKEQQEKAESIKKNNVEKQQEDMAKAAAELQSSNGHWISDNTILRQIGSGERAGAVKDKIEANAQVEEIQSKIDRLMEQGRLTKGMVAGTEQLGELQQQQTQAMRTNATEIEKQTGVAQQTAEATQSQQQYYTGGFVGGGIAINTNGLAQETTLRGIWELLNGGPPQGGWGQTTTSYESISASSSVIKPNAFASGIRELVSQIEYLPNEAMGFINSAGKFVDLVHGTEDAVNGSDIQKVLAEYVNEQMLLALHNHPYGDKALSQKDVAQSLANSLNNANRASVRMNGSLADGTVTLIDTAKIPESAHNTINSYYKKYLLKALEENPDVLDRKESADVFGGDIGIRGDIINNPEKKAKAEKLMNDALIAALDEVGHANAFKQFDVSSIRQFVQQAIKPAQEQVATNVAQSGAHAAIEASKGDEFHGFNPKNKSVINTLRNIKQGSTLTNAENVEKLLQDGFIPRTFGQLSRQVEGSGEEIVGVNNAQYEYAKYLHGIAKQAQQTPVQQPVEPVPTQTAENVVKQTVPADPVDVPVEPVTPAEITPNPNAKPVPAKKTAAEEVMDALRAGYKADPKFAEIEGEKLLYDAMDKVNSYSKSKDKTSDQALRNIGNAYVKIKESLNTEIVDRLGKDMRAKIEYIAKAAQAKLDASGVEIGKDLKGEVITPELLKFLQPRDERYKLAVGKIIGKSNNPIMMRNGELLQSAFVSAHVPENKAEKELVREKLGLEQQITEEKKKQSATKPKDDTKATEAQAGAEAKVTAEEEKQLDLAQQKEKVEEKTTGDLQAQAQAASDANKTKVEPAPIESASGIPQGTGGGIPGLVNTLGQLLQVVAKDTSVQEIIKALANGVKSTGSGGKQGDGGEKKSLNLGADEALEKIKAHVNDVYPGAVKTGNLRANANSYSVDFWRDSVEAQKEAEKIQEKINKLEDDGKANTEAYNNLIQQRNSLLQKQEKITLRINKDTGEMTSKVGIENFAVGANAAEKELQTVQNVLSQLHDANALQFNPDGSLNAQNQSINNWIQSMQALQVQRDKFASEGTLFDSKNQQVLSQMTAQTAQYRKEVMDLLRVEGKFGGDVIDTFANPQALAGTDELYNKLLNIATATGKVDMTTVKYDANSNTLSYTIAKSKNQVQDMTLHMNSLSGAVTQQTGELRHVDTAWQKFVKSLGAKFQEVGRYLLSFGSIYRVWGTLKQGVDYIKEIDNALTELRKVTDETDATYARFLQTASKTAGVVGSTVSELTQMSAEWARLGYNIQQSADLAKSTAILLNVSEFQDATQASEALISTIQAFGYAANESMHVVDVLNEVGNSYAISSDGIATALQDSASALMEGGNNLEQAVALVASANRVVQDPNSVGSALRTISLRLRGTSVQVLEELGEETDNVIESTSKLQSKIKALSGIDILTESGDYKDTYTILKEIGTVWEDMSDIDQAALLELMAGKNRANTLSAILSNMKDLEGAYESAMDAEGSALRENETYLDSIQGRIDLFNNSVQTMWMNFIDSEVVKFIVDLGTGLIQTVEKVGLLNVALVALTVTLARKQLMSGLKNIFKPGTKNIQGFISHVWSLITATKELTKADVARALSSKNVEKGLISRIIAEAGLKGITSALTKEQIKQTAATLSQAFANKTLTTSQYLAAMSSMGLKTALQGLWTVIKANPVMWISALVMVAANAFDHFHTTAAEAMEATKESFEEMRSVVESTKSTIQSLEGELTTIEEQINSFDGKELSFADEEEVNRLKKQRFELQKNLDMQNEMLKLQQENSNKKAIAAVKAYTKASSEGAEETKNNWQNWAKWGVAAVATVAAAVATGGASLAVQLGSMAAAGIAGYAVGNVAGEAIGSAVTENEGSYDSWYKTYTDAIETARAEEQKALEEYQKDTSNIDKLDKWQEMQQKTIDIESEMYEHINQMQSYFADAEYGQSAEMDAALDEWNTFRDKFLIDQGSKDAKVNALDRLFGEDADEVVKAYRDKIKGDIQNGEAVDFQEMIDVTGLDDDLDALGITTQDVADYFTQLGEAGADAIEEIDVKDLVSELAKVEGALGSVKSVMEEFRTEGIVSASTLEGMQEEFGGLGDAWETYVETMLSGTASMSEAQAATEALAKAYLDAHANNITDDTKLTYIAQLEKFGVDNAKELVDSYINNDFFDTTNIKSATTEFGELSDKIAEAADAYDDIIEKDTTWSKGNVDYNNRPIVSAEAMQEKYPEFDGDVATTYDMGMALLDSEGNIAYTVKVTPILEDGTVIDEKTLVEYVEGELQDAYNNGGIQGVLDADKNGYNIVIATAVGEVEQEAGVLSEFDTALQGAKDVHLELVNMSAQGLIDLAAEKDIVLELADAYKILQAAEEARNAEAEYQDNIVASAEKNKKIEEENAALLQNRDKIIGSLRAGYGMGGNEYADRAFLLYNDIIAAQNRSGKYENYSEEKANQIIASLKEDLEATLTDLGWGYTLEDFFPALQEVSSVELDPDVVASKQKWDEAEKKFQDLLNGMNLTITPEIETAEAIDELARFESGMKSLSDAYQEYKEEGVVSFGTLSGLGDTFGNIQGVKDEYRELIKLMGTSGTEISAIEAQMEKLATAYLSTIDANKMIIASEEERQVVIDNLTNMGVQNAEEIVNAKLKAIAEVQEAYGIDVSNYTSAEAAKLAAAMSTVYGVEVANSGLVTELANTYGIDLRNFTGTEAEKVEKAKEAAKAIAKAHRDAQIAELDVDGDAFYEGIDTNDPRAMKQAQLLEQKWKRETQSQRDAINAQYNQAIADIDKVTFDSKIDTAFAGKDVNLDFNLGDDFWTGEDSGSDSDSEIDWLDHYFTKIENKIKEKEADLENVLSADVESIDDKNTIIDGIIGLYESKIPLLKKAINAYENRATTLFNGFSSDIQNKILNGSIDINEYDDETAEKIQDYFDYITKASDLEVELDGVKVTIADFSLQKFDNASTAFDNEIEEALQSDEDLLQSKIDLLEEQGEIVSPKMYEDLIAMENTELGVLHQKKKALEDILNAEVAAGRVTVGSSQWYEMKGAIDDVSGAIVESTNKIEGFQNEIQNLHWDSFDRLMDEFDHLGSEIDFVYGLISDDDKVVDEFGNWTSEGVTALALMAQEMERAKQSAKHYENEIATLNNTWQESGYSQTEYEEKLRELKEKHWDSIEAYDAAKDAIIELNKVRVEAAKEAIDKEIEALEEKNEKLKEELDLEKEQYDWQKQVSEKEKSIADIQRRLNALAGDNSASAIAERRKLQAELAQAQAEMDDMWYEHGIDEQKKTLDEGLENYKENKEDEKEALDESLKDENALVQDAFDLINTKVGLISSTLTEFENKHGVKLSSVLVDPWKSGVGAIDDYIKRLGEIVAPPPVEPPPVEPHPTPEPTPAPKPTPTPAPESDNTPSYKEYTIKKYDTLSEIAQDELGSASRWPEIYELNRDVIKDPNLIYPGQKIKLPHYAKGTMGAEYDHWAMVDELGPELQLVPDGSGRLSYITRGTSVIPHDLSEKLVDLALDPTKVLENSRPNLGAPHITTNNFDIDLSFGSLVHVDHCDQNTLPDLQKMVRGEFDNMMKTLNQKLKRK